MFLNLLNNPPRILIGIFTIRTLFMEQKNELQIIRCKLDARKDLSKSYFTFSGIATISFCARTLFFR